MKVNQSCTKAPPAGGDDPASVLFRHIVDGQTSHQEPIPAAESPELAGLGFNLPKYLKKKWDWWQDTGGKTMQHP